MGDWIDDGYAQWIDLPDGLRCSYRPLSRSSRIQVIARLQESRDSDRRLWLARQFIHERVTDYRESAKFYTAEECAEILSIVLGNDQQDLEDEYNLRSGVRLLLLYPRLAQVSCQNCREVWMNPLTGVIHSRHGRPLQREGGTLCEVNQQGCPAGHYQRSRRLSEKNLKAYRHYLECQATGQFPDDSLVRRNARIIRWATEKALHDQRHAQPA